MKTQSDTVIEVETTLTARRLAQRISHKLWNKYDDQHGYRTEKQEHNKRVDPKDPDSLIFYFGQFDVINQLRFIRDLNQRKDSPAKEQLNNWIKQYLDWYHQGDEPKLLETKDLT